MTIPMDVTETCQIMLDNRVLGGMDERQKTVLKMRLAYLPGATEVIDYDEITIKFDTPAREARAHVEKLIERI